MAKISLRKCRSLFKEGCARFRKMEKKLPSEELQSLKENLLRLDRAIEQKNVDLAEKEALQLKSFLETRGKKSIVEPEEKT